MLDHELDALGTMKRAALAATCLEHVIDFYRLGNFSLRAAHARTDLGVPPDTDLLDHALEVTWQFVGSGQADPATVRAVIDGLRQPPDGAEVDDMCTAGSTVVGAASEMMKAISDPTPSAALVALERCSSAVWDGVLTATGDDDAGQDGCAEEERWQAQVLARTQQVQGSPLSRSTFTDLLAAPVSWQQHKAAYSEQAR